ncbi:thiaminase II [Furfurilactobacillus entadae]|uniref:thiaminase II n=1 Tax=Furfurilactobacillus entadae TaxID=2922307 RepID=UPI0035E5663C
MAFSIQAKAAALPLWQASLDHPFIEQLSAGTLPEAVFRYYLIQDHHYLRDFAKLHELTAAATTDPKVTALLLELAADLRAGEMATRATYFKTLKITDDEVATTPLAPTTYAYTSHMYRTLTEQGPEAAIAGLLPCAWLYADIGETLTGKQSPVPIYQAWLDSYQAASYTDAVATQLALTDRVAAHADEQTQQAMNAAFKRSTFYECSFWQMALDQETWA